MMAKGSIAALMLGTASSVFRTLLFLNIGFLFKILGKHWKVNKTIGTSAVTITILVINVISVAKWPQK